MKHRHVSESVCVVYYSTYTSRIAPTARRICSIKETPGARRMSLIPHRSHSAFLSEDLLIYRYQEMSEGDMGRDYTDNVQRITNIDAILDSRPSWDDGGILGDNIRLLKESSYKNLQCRLMLHEMENRKNRTTMPPRRARTGRYHVPLH